MIVEWKEYRVVCDICGLDGSGVELYYWYKGGMKYQTPDEQLKTIGKQMPFSIKNNRDARKIAKKYGWLHKKGKDICPICSKKEENN